MERSYVWVVAVALLTLSALAEHKVTYFQTGGGLSLMPPRTPTERISGILWKFDGNLLAEWVENKIDLVFYGNFAGRTTLNTNNGHLQIKDLTKGDTGLYTVEINSQAQTDGYNVKVIAAVPVPEILVGPLTCGPDQQQCSLTCYGAVAADAEPITYSWMKGGELLDASTQLINISNHAERQTYTCQMKNPVNQSRSKPKLNPFFKEDKQPETGIIVGLLSLVLVLGLAVVGFWKREAIKNWMEKWKSPGAPPITENGNDANRSAESVPMNSAENGNNRGAAEEV